MNFSLPVEDVGSLGEVEYTLALFGPGNYSIIEIEAEGKYGKYYIIPDGYCRSVEIPRDSRLLLHLLEVVNGPASWDWAALSEIVPSEKAMWWTRKYGLPGYDPDFYARFHEYAYPLSLFRKHAATLFLMFKLYEAVYYEDEKEMIRYLSALIKHPDFERYPPEKYEEWQKEFSKRPLKNKKEYVLFQIRRIVNREIKNIRVFFSLTDPNLYLHATSHFDICYYQLGLLLTKNDETAWKNIKKCVNCNKYFWGHGNKKYCNACDRRTVWSRNHPKRRRGNE